MRKPFKFRYASELAGVFVIFALALLLIGVFLAGHSQGWFEGKFILKAKFDTKSGSFGLKEGNEVIILSTPAGRVGYINPTSEGTMETTFIIKERFRQFVSQDSVARIKKKFVAAGDSFVEIESGDGPVINDGDYIKCEKDVEIMDKAEAILTDVQEVILPMVKEVQGILEHVNVILGDVEKGKGIAGSVVNDGKMSADIKDMIRNSNALIQESQTTFRESTRLIRAVQRSWLIRKYVKQEDSSSGSVLPFNLSDESFSGLKDYSIDALEVARMENNPTDIALHACNLGYCKLSEGDLASVNMLLSEARRELEKAGKKTIYPDLLKAEFLKVTGEQAPALQTVTSVINSLDRSDREIHARCRLLAAELCCEADDFDGARRYLKESEYYIKKLESSALMAASAHIHGMILDKENKYATAAGQFDKEVELRSRAGQFVAMVNALKSAGSDYEREKMNMEAADRYFRAGRSLANTGKPGKAEDLLKQAVISAHKAGDEYTQQQAGALLTEIQVNR